MFGFRLPSVGRGCAAVLFAVAACAGGVSADELDIARAEFAKFYAQVCGRKPGADLLALSVDPKVSKKGNDAYTITSVGKGVRIVGSNGRSCLYGVYDLLERRAGCRWFWDGDRVPRRDRIDLSGLDVREESRFEFRGLRYFAHRGLTRFQAEHWGLEDWKKEIDWCVKSRLNLMMLRIGQDDLFQKAFPDVVDYPDPSKPVPEAMDGYNNRSLFWSLQYRGNLRKQVQAYAFARGMMIPEDFGTMSHWYSRTPYQFLNRMKPDFYPQQGGCYGHPTDRVWDIRNPKWLNAYWKITEAAIANYGKPDLLHTIGIGERYCATNRADNLALKERAINVTTKLALSHYPDSRILLAGWDFWDKWQPDEIRSLFTRLDPKKIVLWDYEVDAVRYRHNITQWGVMGKFPYTFGIFEAFESALDPRADYALIEERQRMVDNDPFCCGYLFWPESSHTDPFMLRFFPANAWKPGGKTFDTLIGPFCRDRYGKDAPRMEKLWRMIQPVCRQYGWAGNCAHNFIHNFGDVVTFEDLTNGGGAWHTIARRDDLGVNFPYACSAHCFGELGKINVSDPQVYRDAVDLARMLMDRRLVARKCRLVTLWRAWLKGEGVTTDEFKAAAEAYVRDGQAFVDILGSHEDYSLYAALLRLDAIEKIRNPDFDHVLVDNASNGYCRSHHFESAIHWYQPMVRAFAEAILAKVAKGDRTPLDLAALRKRSDACRAKMLTTRLSALTAPVRATPEAWRALMNRCGERAPNAFRGELKSPLLVTGSGRIYVIERDGSQSWEIKGCGNSHRAFLKDGKVYYANGELWECDFRTKARRCIWKPAKQKGGGVYGFMPLADGGFAMVGNDSEEVVEIAPKADGTYAERLRFKVSPARKDGSRPKPGDHGRFRMMKKTAAGTYLVCAMGGGCVREYDRAGKLVWEQFVPGGAFDVIRRANGNTLISYLGGIAEYTPAHEVVWQFKPSDLPEMNLKMLCSIQETAEGTLVVGTYGNRSDDASHVTFFEMTRDKKVVWSWASTEDYCDMTVYRL